MVGVWAACLLLEKKLFVCRANAMQKELPKAGKISEAFADMLRSACKINLVAPKFIGLR
jgi:hypothetical protein